MDDNISKIKDRVDIVDLVSSYIKLQKAGMNFKARCPFHNEKSGSFFVSPERQIWHCFGCGLGGDIFGFVKEIDGVEFPDALRTLAARAGIQLTSFRPEQRDTKTKLYEITELATKFYEKQLHESTEGKEALKYLKDRGLNDESIKNFRLGYSPDAWDTLHSFLERNFDAKDIVAAGISIKKDNRDGYFDRFRSRIMFPLSDANGVNVGFTGRVFGALAKKKDVGKYVNTPQTVIYDKSRILYGLDKGRIDIRRENKCLVVEGNMDVVASHQAGVRNVVASSGTALTDGHLKILRRYTSSIDLCFDADEAGEIAAMRGIGLALARGFNIGMLEIDEEGLKDPADYIKRHGDKWLEYVKGSRPFMDTYFSKGLKKFDIKTALGKKEFSQQLLPMVASVSNKIEQAHWIGEIALALKVSEDAIRQELIATKSIVSDLPVEKDTERRPIVEQTPKEQARLLGMFEESLLGMVMKEPKLVSDIPEEVEELFSPHVVKLCKEIRVVLKQDSKAAHDTDELMTRLISAEGDQDNMRLEFAYLKSQALWNEFPQDGMKSEFDKLLNYIKKRTILAQLETLEFDIKTAERAQDTKQLDTLLARFSKLSQHISNG